MLLSLTLILISAFLLGQVMKKCKLPPLLGMLLVGILFSPYILDLIDPVILGHSAIIRQFALVVILFRAGLSLDIQKLKLLGRPAILMSVIPATVEIIATTILAGLFFDVTPLEAVIMGTVLAAVSPAIVIPQMIKLKEKKYGTERGIPELLMTGTSANSIFVVILFTIFIGISVGGEFDFTALIGLPVGIIAVLIGVILVAKFPMQAKPVATVASKIWIPAEIMLFALVGATINPELLMNDGLTAVSLILLVLSVRFIGVLIALIKTPLTLKERLFCGFAYLPKATVQAAIGSLPLLIGVNAGGIILSIAVWSIVITAPLGALGIDFSYQRLLEEN